MLVLFLNCLCFTKDLSEDNVKDKNDTCNNTTVIEYEV